MPTVITAGAGKALGEDTAFEVFAKRLADVGAGCVVITLAQMAADIVVSMARPILLATGDLAHIGASVGIARFPLNGSTCEALLHAADLALYEVKRRGKNSFAFTPVANASTRNSMSNELL